MKIDGISLIEGASVSNFSVVTGTSYPSNPNAGELFFRTDSPNVGLYVHDGSTWGYVSTASSTAWSGITGTPTTLSGYGITDAVNLSGTQTITGAKTFDLQIVSSVSTGTAPFAVSSTTTVSNLSSKYFDGFSYSHFFDGATWLQTGRIPAFTGDVTAPGASATLTLATVNSNVGSFGSATQVGTFTVNAKGLITAASSTTITPAFSSITSKPTTLSGYGITDAVAKAGSTMDLNANLVFNGGTVTGIPSPTGSTDVVNKAYVDAAVSTLNVHAAVEAATTANLTATYSNGTSGVGATLTNSDTQAAFAVDGYTAPVNARILVKNQTTQTQNGIYTVTTAGSGSVNWVLTRATDADNSVPGELAPGDFVFVTEGSTQASTGWVETTIGTGTGDSIVIGTNNVTYTQFSGAGTYLAGTGLSLTGTTFNVNLGAGIAELPSTEVGIDVHATGGLMTTVDNSTSSTNTAAQLALTNVGTAGTYKSVTTDSKGRVTAGTNPTTLSGFGITDAVLANTVITAGTATKITYDAKGLVTSGTTLSASDIPNITESQVTGLVSDLSNKQPLDADLTAIAALTGTSGFLKTNGSGTWSVDTATYLTGNQTITLSGDITGSGTTAITGTLASVGTAGTYKSVTTDAKGRVTAGTNPTTLSGFGITDAVDTSTTQTIGGAKTFSIGPIVPTAAANTNTTQAASTAFVQTAVSNAVTAAVSGVNIQYFTSSGTFTVPAGITKVRVQLYGGGGSGGFCPAVIYLGGGGGAGGFGEGVYTVTPGANITVTIGAGGAAGANNSGGNSVFTGFLTCNGGTFGTNGVSGVSAGTQGTGGSVTGATIAMPGGPAAPAASAIGGLSYGPYGGDQVGGQGYGYGGKGSNTVSTWGTAGKSGICIVMW
jgi:hypothetical protein